MAALLISYEDPLNLSRWRKIVFVVLLSICKDTIDAQRYRC